MDVDTFQTATGLDVSAVTAEEMRDVDRVAVEEFGLSMLQMMEQGGRGLARETLDRYEDGSVVVLAGAGGNGGGGLACARHLANRELPVTVALDRQPADLEGPLRGSSRELVQWVENTESAVLSLDVPSGIDATTGRAHGDAVRPTRTFTLALPKTGVSDIAGVLVLGDISVPAGVYETLEIPYTPPFGDELSIGIDTTRSSTAVR